MGTYFVLTDQITELADRLDKKGQLKKLFQQAHPSKNDEEARKDTNAPTEAERAGK